MNGGAPHPPGTPARPSQPLNPRTILVIALVALGASGLADSALAARGFTLAVIYVPPLLALAWLAGWRFAAACTAAAAVINFGVDAAMAGSLASPWLTHAGNLALFILCVPVERGVATARFMLEYTQHGKAEKAAIQSVRLGQRIVLVLVRRSEDAAALPARPSSVQVLVDAGQALAASPLPTTVLCVELLEQFVQPGAHILDLGCGTGLLSLAALKLGAATATAADIQIEAVQATLANARLNDLSGRLEARVGSLEEVIGPLVARGTEVFDIALANVLPDVLMAGLQAGLARTLAPAGVLILSGFKPEQEARLLLQLDQAGLQVVARREADGWVALASRRLSS